MPIQKGRNILISALILILYWSFFNVFDQRSSVTLGRHKNTSEDQIMRPINLCCIKKRFEPQRKSMKRWLTIIPRLHELMVHIHNNCFRLQVLTALWPGRTVASFKPRTSYTAEANPCTVNPKKLMLLITGVPKRGLWAKGSPQTIFSLTKNNKWSQMAHTSSTFKHFNS